MISTMLPLSQERLFAAMTNGGSRIAATSRSYATAIFDEKNAFIETISL